MLLSRTSNTSGTQAPYAVDLPASVPWHGQANSLDVERKHQVDKISESRKVVGVARASRNSILRRYRLQRLPVLKETLAATGRARKLRHANKRALAVMRCPDLQKRPRGRLHWEQPVAAEDMGRTSHMGDMDALAAYVAENNDALEAEAAALRGGAAAAQRAWDPERMPMLNKEWLSWLDENSSLFAGLLREATARRRNVSHRLSGGPDSSQALPRIFPHTPKVPATQWAEKLMQGRKGWFALGAGAEVRVVMFFCGLGRQGYGHVLQKEGAKVYSFDLNCSGGEMFKPLHCLEALSTLSSDSTVWSLDIVVQHVVPGISVTVKVQGATEVLVAARPPRRSAAAEEQSGSDVEESGLFEEAWEDVTCLHSENESGAEHEQEECAHQTEIHEDLDGEDERKDPAERSAPGSYVVESEGYFTLVDNPHFDDAKMLVRPRWCIAPPSGMGTSSKSKTLKIRDYDTEETAPECTYLVLRSWKLWRFSQHGFIEAHHARKAYYADEMAALRESITQRKVPGGGTGSVAADAKIRAWTPGALPIPIA